MVVLAQLQQRQQQQQRRVPGSRGQHLGLFGLLLPCWMAAVACWRLAGEQLPVLVVDTCLPRFLQP